MKNKLTAEQAQWLIERLRKYEYRSSNTLPVCYKSITMENVEQVINQCTEKEFPRFSSDQCDINISRDYDDLIIMYIHGNPTFEQFKELTQACNKIVEWIDSQDEQ